jgi:hypothetical protein
MVCLGLGTVLAKEVWQGEPYMHWSQQEAVALLTNSPWAVSKPIKREGSLLDQSSAPREGSGCVETTMGTMEEGADQAVAQTAASASSLSRGTRRYTVRFVSALPIRMAIARWAILNGRITAEQARVMLNQDPYNGNIVVSLSASNDQDWSELNSFTTDSLAEETYLLLEKSKKRLFANRYVPPNQSGIGEALFYFPRFGDGTVSITPAEKEVSFICRLSDRTQFHREFRLKKMVYNGELAI